MRNLKGLGFSYHTHNHMDKNMEHEIEAGFVQGLKEDHLAMGSYVVTFWICYVILEGGYNLSPKEDLHRPASWDSEVDGAGSRGNVYPQGSKDPINRVLMPKCHIIVFVPYIPIIWVLGSLGYGFGCKSECIYWD